MITQKQWEIIAHRLGESSAIADALTDAAPGEKPAVKDSWEMVNERAEFLLENPPEDIDGLRQLDLEILRDCCEGSTYFADIQDAVERGEISKGQMLSAYKAAYALEGTLGCSVAMY